VSRLAAPLAPVTIPSPEQFGVTAAKPAGAGADLSEARRRLKDLGAVCFQLEDLPQGQVRVVCLLSIPGTDRQHRIEAQASSEFEAVRLGLERAEQWAARR
jgi:hypothetical protein